MNHNGTSFQTLFTFTPESGGAPDGGLLLLEDTFYPSGPSPMLAMNDEMVEAQVRIYPNPFTDTFRAEVSEGDASFVVCDLSGVVRMSSMNAGENEMGSQLEKGIYLLTINHGNKRSTYRLVKN
jgi:hypothetical protein